ncbi:MAG: hypothetical protein H7175_04455 [Burkholderiales bacterium]|nr:hypothetical protein [Anaerolineae bacterium]
MRRVLFYFFLVFAALGVLAALPAFAQQNGFQNPSQSQPSTTPDYAIRNIRSTTSGDLTETTIEFEVVNEGAAAPTPTTTELVIVSRNQSIASESLRALQSTEIVTVTFRIPTTALAAVGNVVSLRAIVNADTIGDVSSGNNIALISVVVPAPMATAAAATAAAGGNPVPPRVSAATPAAGSTPVSADDSKDDTNDTTASGPGFTIPLVNVTIDPSNSQHIALLAGIVAIAAILLWLFITILRLMFQKRPEFTVWQPPYANMPMLNPDSIAGRRQQWQAYAQSNAILVPPEEGIYHVRKLVVGVNGQNFSGWQVKAVRVSQYDMYGRVARSTIVAPNGVAKRFDKAVRKGRNQPPEKVAKMARPVAKALLGPFKKRLNTRNAMLPLALDVRLQGTHGEVRILFELFQCQMGVWQLVDEWEPEMTVMGKALNENFTFTVYGQRPGEPFTEFRARIEDDLTTVITAMVMSAPVQRQPQPQPQPQMQPPQVQQPQAQRPPQSQPMDMDSWDAKTNLGFNFDFENGSLDNGNTQQVGAQYAPQSKPISPPTSENPRVE